MFTYDVICGGDMCGCTEVGAEERTESGVGMYMTDRSSLWRGRLFFVVLIIQYILL